MNTKDPAKAEVRLITKSDLCGRLQTSEASVDRWLRTDPDFPQPVRLGPNSIRWQLDEVTAYIRTLPRVEYDDHAFSPSAQGGEDGV